jgi:hypothetical protein
LERLANTPEATPKSLHGITAWVITLYNYEVIGTLGAVPRNMSILALKKDIRTSAAMHLARGNKYLSKSRGHDGESKNALNGRGNKESEGNECGEHFFASYVRKERREEGKGRDGESQIG